MHRRGQLSFPLVDARRPRKRPGRRPNGPRAGVSHLRRPAHCDRYPLHVTVRLRSGLPSLRSQSMFIRVVAQLHAAKRRFLRIVHWSVQSNHVHLLVEATDQGRLTQGMKGFAVRVAKGLNDLLGTRGRIWADRYHARALKTPRETRNAIVYVLCNRARHSGQLGLDRRSSAPYFSGWADDVTCAPADGSPADWPVTPAGTWLLSAGWKRYGPIRSSDQPAAVRQRHPG